MPVEGMRNAILEMTSNERWGSCYIAHDGGCVQYKQPTFSQGLTFELYKDGKHERMGIRFVEVTIIQDSSR